MTRVRVWSFIFGILFVAGGVMGFMPKFMTGDKLLGFFQVDTIHNMIHLVSGILGLLAVVSARYSRSYLRLIGLIYGVLAILGFFYGAQMATLAHMQINVADNVLHLGIAIVALYVGFTAKLSASR